ncbi:MAG: hypothetical protein HON09_07340 [Flavobacteriaceae bacterium]|nr:hypothetical protein [Flavobacteriaceae bacterium]
MEKRPNHEFYKARCFFILILVSLMGMGQTVTSVSSTAVNGTYKVGDVLPITVTFSANVTVTGTPRLTLETGSMDVMVDYTSGSGTSTLTFNYTAAPLMILSVRVVGQ